MMVAIKTKVPTFLSLSPNSWEIHVCLLTFFSLSMLHINIALGSTICRVYGFACIITCSSFHLVSLLFFYSIRFLLLSLCLLLLSFFSVFNHFHSSLICFSAIHSDWVVGRMLSDDDDVRHRHSEHRRHIVRLKSFGYGFIVRVEVERCRCLKKSLTRLPRFPN